MPITRFSGDYAFLDHTTRIEKGILFPDEGIRARNVESAYVALRLHWLGSIAAATRVLRETTGVKAKSQHKELVEQGAASESSLRFRLAAILAADLAKFVMNPSLGDRLLQTGNDDLIECGHNDPVWGVDDEGNGANLAGKSVMWVREQMSRPDFVRPTDEELEADFFSGRYADVATQMIDAAGLAA